MNGKEEPKTNDAAATEPVEQKFLDYENFSQFYEVNKHLNKT